MTFEKLPTESTKAFEAFAIYRDSGPKRSTDAVATVLSKAPSLIRRWSRVHRWVERAESFDRHVASILRDARERQLRAKSADWAARMIEVRESEWDDSQELRRQARELLAKKKMSVGEALRALELAFKLERLAVGLPADRIEHSGIAPAAVNPVLVILPHNNRD